jgi:hypothetical protein
MEKYVSKFNEGNYFDLNNLLPESSQNLMSIADKINKFKNTTTGQEQRELIKIVDAIVHADNMIYDFLSKQK